jgi:ubiquinone/menaquinone biosynthesis C-methylase UbiE
MLIPDYKGAIEAIYRVLRHNGRVAITTWNRHGHWDYLTRAARIVLQDKSYPPPTFYDPKWTDGRYLAKVMKFVGFR